MSTLSDVIIGGIAGGTSSVRMVLVNAEGSLLGHADGCDTNQWLIGMKAAAEHVQELVREARRNANISSDTLISYLGITISGVDTEDNRNKFRSALIAIHPPLAIHIEIWNDAFGTLFTVSDGAALVLISGTGSICSYIRPNLTFERVGGMGYLLGDGGSGYWIASRAIRKLISAEDGMIDLNYSLDQVRKLVYEHFEIKNLLELLPIFYGQFDKKKIAQLCERLADIARSGDKMAKACFHSAGMQLGNHVKGALRRAAKELGSTDSVTVICCGSVFKSWELLRAGFKEALNPENSTGWKGIIQLIQIQCTTAYGAARLVVREKTNFRLPFPPDAANQLDEIPFVVQCSRN